VAQLIHPSATSCSLGALLVPPNPSVAAAAVAEVLLAVVAEEVLLEEDDRRAPESSTSSSSPPPGSAEPGASVLAGIPDSVDIGPSGTPEGAGTVLLASGGGVVGAGDVVRARTLGPLLSFR
jgi:hypothetical protein